MKLLIQSVKPYFVSFLIAVFFLFCQSGVDLALPSLMSRIVNVGIQQGGVEYASPEVIPEESFELMTRFMTESEEAAVRTAYMPLDLDSLSPRSRASFLKRWPGAADTPVLVPDSRPGGKDSPAEAAFRHASLALKFWLSDRGFEGGSPEIMEDLLPLVSASPEEEISACIRKASGAPESELEGGYVFPRLFYSMLGADAGAIQNRFILKVGALMLLAALFLTVFAVSAGFFTSRLGTSVARDLRRKLFAHVNTFTTAEFDRFGTASLITRCTNDVVQIQMLLSVVLKTICYAPIIGIGGIIMALTRSPGMAWIIALVGVLVAGLLLVLFSVAIPRFRIMQRLIDRLNLVGRENLSGILVIRAFSTEKFEEKRFDSANRELADNNRTVFRAMASAMPVMMLVMNGVSLLIVWFGGKQIAASAMQVGDMMAFIQYTMQIIMSFVMISMVFVMVPRALVSASRISEVLNCESSITDDPHPLHLPERAAGTVEFHDVSFRYEGADENVLDHISFTARPGETTAFIGSTGSGKSTLVNLIPRFADVTEGSITLDGIDIRKLPLKELRDAIAYVPQKGILFSGDIRSNLQYGDPTADESAIQEAADIAQASEFIREMPDGFSASVSQGGGNVSGGQRQRLSIARALVKKAPVCIFDDTFSALDFKTDAKLRKALAGRTEHAAVLIVAQRISTILHADQIVVLDEGRIVGIGTHRQLLSTCSTYREIAESQLSKEELAG